MTDSLEKTKLITKLIRIISDKEKQLSAYRHRAKQNSNTSSSSAPNYSECKIEQQCMSNAVELKQLASRVAEMEEKVTELTDQLVQEAALTAEAHLRIQQMEQKEQMHRKQIEELRLELAKQELKGREWRQKAEAVSEEKKQLQQQIQKMSVEAHYSHILQRKIQALTKDLLDHERIQLKIAQNIDDIHSKYCNNNQSHSPATHKTDLLFAKLASIQLTLQQQTFFQQHEHVLNDTIDGLSIISFEETLDQVACLTDRENQVSNWKRGSAWREPLTCDNSERTSVMRPAKIDKQNKNYNR